MSDDWRDAGGVTPDDMARWFDGTVPLWDMLIEQGFAPCARDDVSGHVRLAEMKTHPYGMHPELSGINASSYRHWFNSKAGKQNPVLVESSMRSALYPSCPLAWCETFNYEQEQWPVSKPPIDWANASTIVRVGPRDITFSSLVDAELLRGAIGRQMVIHGSTDGGDWFQISPDHAPRLQLIYRGPVFPGVPQRHEAKPSRVPALVDQNRRRLDGRRR